MGAFSIAIFLCLMTSELARAQARVDHSSDSTSGGVVDEGKISTETQVQEGVKKAFLETIADLDKSAKEAKTAKDKAEFENSANAFRKILPDTTNIPKEQIGVFVDFLKPSDGDNNNVVLVSPDANGKKELNIGSGNESGVKIKSGETRTVDDKYAKALEGKESGKTADGGKVVLANPEDSQIKNSKSAMIATYAASILDKQKSDEHQNQGVATSKGALDQARSDIGGSPGFGGIGDIHSSTSTKSIADSLAEAAKSSLGVGNGNLDLANFKAASPEVRSSLSNLSLNSGGPGYNGLSQTDTLLNLAGDRNFQDLISSRLSKQAVRDFNLATAGAEILGNPNLPEIGVAAAKSYILNNLSSAQIVASSPALKKLSSQLGGTGNDAFLLQDPLTLRWLALANELGNGDKAKIPPFLAMKIKEYKSSYPKLVAWLKLLNENDAMGSLSQWKPDWAPERYSELWQDKYKSFLNVHRDTAEKEKALLKEVSASLTSAQKKKSEAFVSDLGKISRWIKKQNKMSSSLPLVWVKNVGPATNLGQIWYKNYKDEYQWAHYHKSKLLFVALTYERVQKDSGLKQLIVDAQEWAMFLEESKATLDRPLAAGSSNTK